MADLWDGCVGKGLSGTDTYLNRQSSVDVFPMGILRAVGHFFTCRYSRLVIIVETIGFSCYATGRIAGLVLHIRNADPTYGMRRSHASKRRDT